MYLARVIVVQDTAAALDGLAVLYLEKMREGDRAQLSLPRVAEVKMLSKRKYAHPDWDKIWSKFESSEANRKGCTAVFLNNAEGCIITGFSNFSGINRRLRCTDSAPHRLATSCRLHQLIHWTITKSWLIEVVQEPMRDFHKALLMQKTVLAVHPGFKDDLKIALTAMDVTSKECFFEVCGLTGDGALNYSAASVC
jgi:hypothetical protein